MSKGGCLRVCGLIMQKKIHKILVLLTACLPAATYITWLNAYYWLLEGGRYKALIQPKLWLLLVLALILLLAFSAAFISRFSIKPAAAIQFDAWVKAAILVIPAVFLWAIYGQSLGSDAFAKRLMQTGQSIPIGAQNSDNMPSIPSSDHAVSLMDLILYAEKFYGERVAVEGMVYRGVKIDKNSFKLFRFAIACCAADAVPFSISVRTADEENLDNDTWVRVEGRFNFEVINNKQIASITADKVLALPMPPPEKRYLFF